jgi:hypothetical protein
MESQRVGNDVRVEAGRLCSTTVIASGGTEEGTTENRFQLGQPRSADYFRRSGWFR